MSPPTASNNAPDVTIIDADRRAPPAPFAGADFAADGVKVDVDVPLEDGIVL
jgi:hypothetical protein